MWSRSGRRLTASIDQSSAIALAGLQEREAAFAQVFENAAREKQKYSEATDRQIATTEAEAARALLPPWQAAQQKIVDDYVRAAGKEFAMKCGPDMVDHRASKATREIVGRMGAGAS